MIRERRRVRRALGRVATLLVAGIVLIAAVGAAYLLGVVGAPTVVAVENRFGEVTDETTEVETDLVVNNPNPVGVTLGGTTVDYTVRMNGVAMASGHGGGLSIDRGESTLPFTTRMRNERIPTWWVTHVRRGERTKVVVDATVTASVLGDRSVSLAQERRVETDLLGAFASEETRPVNADWPLVSDPVLYVNRTTAAWGNVTDARTPIDASFRVYNPKTVPYLITEIGYTVTMNGLTVGEGSTGREYFIEGRTTENLSARTTIDNDRLDDWWVSHLRNDQVTDLRIDFHAVLELPGGNEFRVPLDALTYERTVETDIFGNEGTDGGDTGRSGDGSGTTTPSPTAGPTSGDAATPTASTAAPGPTPTTAPDPTRTPAPTSTPTDGGGLLGSGGTPSPPPAGGSGTPTPTPTPTDDGGLLAVTDPSARVTD
jgi:LEA14-like dessication related protein